MHAKETFQGLRKNTADITHPASVQSHPHLKTKSMDTNGNKDREMDEIAPVAGVVPVESMAGDDDEETALLREMLQDAKNYVLSFSWCQSVDRAYFAGGVGKVFAIFLFKISSPHSYVDPWEWIFVGDIPPAYLPLEDSASIAEAFESYIAGMRRWIPFARESREPAPGGSVPPVNVPATPEWAEELDRRLQPADRAFHTVIPATVNTQSPIAFRHAYGNRAPATAKVPGSTEHAVCEAGPLRTLLSAAFWALFLMPPIPSFACSMASCLDNGVELPRSFVVNVAHGGHPLAGVTVVVREFVEEKDAITLFSGVTAADGGVKVGELPPGQYWLDAEFLGITAGSECFHISPSTSKTAKQKLTYEWGDMAPAVRQIAGRLIDSRSVQGGTPISNLLHRVNVPVAEAKLRLRDPLTGAIYNARSNQDGQFAFDGIPMGIYVLHIEAGTESRGRDYESTDQLVRLSSDARWETLELEQTDATNGSCGEWNLELRGVSNQGTKLGF